VLPVLLAAAFGLSAPAFSQPKPAGADDTQQADEHFHKGKELMASGRVKEAREEYLTAFRLRRSYDVAGNLGSAELTLGFPRDAAEHLLFALHHYAASGTTAAQLETAKQRFAEAERQVGRLKVSVSMNGADVLVDGTVVGRAPLDEDVFVEPGERTVEARLAGYEPAKQTIKSGKGTAQLVSLKLTIADPPPVPSASAVPLASASASASPPPVPSGSTAPIVPVGAGGPSKPVLITGGVVTGLAVVAGVVFTVLANGKATDAATKGGEVLKSGGAEACGSAPGCTELHGLLVDRGTFSDAALWTFVGAGVLGVGTAVYALAAPRTMSKTGLRAAPMISASGGGIVLGGAW
jgi:hypothetical protein